MLNSLAQGRRLDGRNKDEFRKIEITPNISVNAEGSAGVKIGETEVYAGVKMSVDKPYPDIPDEGVLMTGAELYPLSSPEFEPGPPSIQGIELARVIDRGIREAGAINTKELCIRAGEKVWMVMVDIVTINDAGNLFDASGIAAGVALKNAVFPKIENDIVEYGTKTDKKLPLKELPVSITVIKIGEHYLVDPTTEEEKMLDARLTVAVRGDGAICAMQKGGNMPVTEEDISAMVDLAMEKAKEVRGMLP